MKLLPVVVSTCWLIWGILLEVSKAAWANHYIGEMVVYSILPAASCLITCFVCRKLDAQKESISSIIKPFAVVFATALLLICLFGQDLMAKTYVMVFHKHLESYAEELLDRASDAALKDEDVYPSDGGAGLVFNSSYWGFYYSPDNTHKVFQGADLPLNVNDNLADWYGEGDNWGKSTRLMENWFWYEASF